MKRRPKPKRRDPSGGNLGTPFLLRAETPEQKQSWERAAQREGKTLSAWARLALDLRAAAHGE